MRNTSVRPTDRIEAMMHTYGNMLFRLCLITLGNASDAEDAVQETLIKYLQKAPEFKDAEHEKAWLITVATNKCKDVLRFKNRHPVVDVDEINEFTNMHYGVWLLLCRIVSAAIYFQRFKYVVI